MESIIQNFYFGFWKLWKNYYSKYLFEIWKLSKILFENLGVFYKENNFRKCLRKSSKVLGFLKYRTLCQNPIHPLTHSRGM
jgi:hypothetical protein